MESQVTSLNSNEIKRDALKLIDLIKQQGSAYLLTPHNPEQLMKIVSDTTPADIAWKHIDKRDDGYVILVERKGSCCGSCQGH